MAGLGSLTCLKWFLKVLELQAYIRFLSSTLKYFNIFLLKESYIDPGMPLDSLLSAVAEIAAEEKLSIFIPYLLLQLLYLAATVQVAYILYASFQMLL